MADRRPLHRNGQVVPEDGQGNEIVYSQSRAALRQRYGTRRIDASAPNAAADDTPSARFNRAMLKYSGDPNAINKAKNDVASGFNDQFQPRPWSLTAPIGGYGTAMGPAKSPNELGTPLPGFPPYGVVYNQPNPQPSLAPISFNLSAPSPLNASQLAPYLPNNPAPSFTPPWRKPAAGQSYVASVLDNVSKWLS